MAEGLNKMKMEGVFFFLIVFGCVLMGCSTTTTAPKTVVEIKTTETRKETVSNLNINCLALANQVGNIEVKQATDNILKISVEKILKNGTEELAQELFEKIKVDLRSDGNTINIETPGLKDQAEIVAKYQNLINVEQLNLEINYVLEVPLSLSKLTLDTEVGNIIAHDLAGAFDLKIGTGNIALNERVDISDNSTLWTSVGNMAVKLQTIAATAKMDLETQTGNMEVYLPQSLQCNLEIEQYMQKKQIREINGGGAAIKVKAVLGQVEVSFYD
jgi:hypothetical protein